MILIVKYSEAQWGGRGGEREKEEGWAETYILSNFDTV